MNKHSVETAPPNLRERVAKAICEAEGLIPNSKCSGRPLWETYLRCADAAISTIAEANSA